MDFDYNEIRNLLVLLGNGGVQQSIRCFTTALVNLYLTRFYITLFKCDDEIITDLEASQVDKLANALYDLKMMLQNGNGLLSLVNDNHKKHILPLSYITIML